jgi:hypothetical protein
MSGTSAKLRVLITVKTYPIPSKKYDELVCTAGVTEQGDFIRLYPINFRDLPFSQQYRKYQWIEVVAVKYTGRDARKESYRPDAATLQTQGPPIPTDKGDWGKRARYVLQKKAASLEELKDHQAHDRTSLGIIRPRNVSDLVVKPDLSEWKASFLAALRQARLWEERTKTLEPPRKMPFKFQYRFECDDSRCRGHETMIEDWEVGALYWRLVDGGATPDEAAAKVRHKFLDELCGADRDTHFFVGTILAHPKSWVVIGVFYPKKRPAARATRSLFD